MKNKKGNITVIAIIIIIVAVTAGIIGWIFAKKSNQLAELPKISQPVIITQPVTESTTQTKPETPTTQPVTQSTTQVQSEMPETQPVSKLSETEKAADWLTYKNKKYSFQFKYPKNWILSDGRLSPQKIEEYEIGSDNAPINFGVYTENQELFLNSAGGSANPEILDYGHYQYQIKESKRNAPDSTVDIGGLIFKRYDLVDYGRYEGTSAGNVILFVGPKMENKDLFVVFEWQQFPGGKTLKINNSEDFVNIVSTFRYVK